MRGESFLPNVIGHLSQAERNTTSFESNQRVYHDSPRPWCHTQKDFTSSFNNHGGSALQLGYWSMWCNICLVSFGYLIPSLSHTQSAQGEGIVSLHIVTLNIVETDYMQKIGGGGGEVLPSTLAHTLLGPGVNTFAEKSLEL